MVVLPYRDRLDCLARYLQQLVMESLGKEKDLMGKIVEQGMTVFGNKGSTDQHAYVQQLREGRSDFFATFIEVHEEGVEEGFTQVAKKKLQVRSESRSSCPTRKSRKDEYENRRR